MSPIYRATTVFKRKSDLIQTIRKIKTINYKLTNKKKSKKKLKKKHENFVNEMNKKERKTNKN